MGKLSKNDLEKEIRIKMDILRQHPTYIINNFTLSEWALIVQNEIYSGITLYRLAELEYRFNQNEDYLYSVPIRDWYIRHNCEEFLHMGK